MPSVPPIVLIVDDDERARRLVRMGLELEGIGVIEAESVGRARAVIHGNVTGVVLDRHLPDGDGLDLLPVIDATCPGATVVIHSTVTDGREPPTAVKVDKGDLPAIVAALDVAASDDDGGGPAPLAVVDLVRAEAEAVTRDWEELCRWDPLLPPDAQPPIARLVVDAVADALQRPQPIGWGPDPALNQVTEMFAANAGSVDIAVGQLICLREAFRRHVAGHVPPGEEAESHARVDMILDRAIWVASRVAAARLERQSQFDPLTGLPSRGAFDRDLERELGRARRYARPLSLVAVEVPGVRAGDEIEVDAEAQVRRVSATLVTNVRAQDVVYRTGPSTFAIVVPETDGRGVGHLVERLRNVPMPCVAYGAATFPGDGDDAVTLLHEAESRLNASV